MEIKDACVIFGVSDLNKITEDSIKDRYRVLGKMYHPDMQHPGNDIDPNIMAKVNSARKVLLDYVENRTMRKERITLEELLNLKEKGHDVDNKLVDLKLNIELMNCLGDIENESVDLTFRTKKNVSEYEFRLKIDSNLFVDGVTHDFKISFNDKETITEISLRDFSVIVRYGFIKLKFIFKIART